ncbi:MAG: alkaline phosphatase family protein [Actinobacteria bacterium]|nr:alkaline phosphatase family protein [Actinomycetota bacterium]MCL6104114.1 alkaline phosphatase family protein [Actinomycetota bacterium]
MNINRLTRREVLGGAIVAGAGISLAGCGSSWWPFGGGGSGGGTPAPGTPGSLPNPSLAPGTDTIPEIENIVVVMLENHSYDNILGMLQRGSGFTLGSNGLPTNTNPGPNGEVVHAFQMPSGCQVGDQPQQSWNDSHIQWDGGKNDGFATSPSDATYAAMGYWTESTLPFTYGLANTFPIATNYFCSVLGPTFPNRRYLISGTSYGLINDIPTLTLSDITQNLTGHPPNGTIFELLVKYGITWKDYNSGLPLTVALYPYEMLEPSILINLPNISQFYTDAASGNLPSFALVEPNYLVNSEENNIPSPANGQSIEFGDEFLASIVNAVMRGPKWDKTLLIWVYDEHGGYYDHVPPPPAVKPDNVAPQLTSSDQPGSFDRYGFRVPMGVVSPYAKANYVSSVVHDHTSILKLIETKWNLPALTYRDGAADNLLDFVDFQSPSFLTPPTLPAPASIAGLNSLYCSPGQVPPVGAVTG